MCPIIGWDENERPRFHSRVQEEVTKTIVLEFQKTSNVFQHVVLRNINYATRQH